MMNFAFTPAKTRTNRMRQAAICLDDQRAIVHLREILSAQIIEYLYGEARFGLFTQTDLTNLDQLVPEETANLVLTYPQLSLLGRYVYSVWNWQKASGRLIHRDVPYRIYTDYQASLSLILCACQEHTKITFEIFSTR